MGFWYGGGCVHLNIINSCYSQCSEVDVDWIDQKSFFYHVLSLDGSINARIWSVNLLGGGGEVWGGYYGLKVYFDR